jgi:hypothetical protein
LASVTGAAAGDPGAAAPVTLAEVASQVEPGATRLQNLTALLRHRVEAEIGAIDWTKEGLRRRYTLSASVVRLDTSRSDAGLQVSCTVSAAVRDTERGTLLAIVQGKARVEGAGPAGPGAEAERSALAGAVRGAITAVSQAIRQVP